MKWNWLKIKQTQLETEWLKLRLNTVFFCNGIGCRYNKTNNETGIMHSSPYQLYLLSVVVTMAMGQ